MCFIHTERETEVYIQLYMPVDINIDIDKAHFLLKNITPSVNHEKEQLETKVVSSDYILKVSGIEVL